MRWAAALAHLALLLLPLASPIAQAQTTQKLVTEIWVHDVPGPPQGDFWDSVVGNVFGTLANPASIYPDAMVCVRPLAGTDRDFSCTSVCRNLQGDARLGGRLKSEECRLPVHVTLRRKDPRMLVVVSEMDEVSGGLRVHATIAQVGVEDPSGCPHDRPCEMAMPRGSLVLSFATDPPAASATAPTPEDPADPTPSPAILASIEPAASAATEPAHSPRPSSCKLPSTIWNDGDLNPPSGLHGPYATAEEAMKRDKAPVIALLLTGTGKSEFGFMILRDLRQSSGGYYTTPPVRSSQDPQTVGRPVILWSDYIASWRDAISSACENENNFLIVASVHTHPQCLVELSWDVCFRSDGFSATDFNHAIEPNPPAELQGRLRFEKIFMIHANDRKVRRFVPEAGDKPISPFWVWMSDSLGNPWSSSAWRDYNERTKAILQYR
jgi:hypothetical protein